MADFPELIPASRTYSLGAVPTTQRSWLDALEVSHLYAARTTAHTLRLEFDEATTDAEWIQIRNHWAGQQGSVLPFAVPAAVWAGHDDYGQVASGLQWRYASAPSRPDGDAGLGPGTVELVAERVTQQLLSSGAASWFGVTVPLTINGSDPGPAPPAIPPGVAPYAETEQPAASVGEQRQPVAESPPGPTQESGGSSYQAVAYQKGANLGELLRFGPNPGEPDPDQPVLQPRGSSPVQPGQPIDYAPACNSPSTGQPYFVPDQPTCDVEGRTPTQLLGMLKNEHGIEPPESTTLQTLKKLYCEANKAASMGLITFKYDTVAKVQQRIAEAESKGKKPGDPIPLPPTSGGGAIPAPSFNACGNIYIDDACGGSGKSVIRYCPDKTKGKGAIVVVGGFKDPPNSGGLTYSPGNGLWWGPTASSPYPFFIEGEYQLGTYDDDGNKKYQGLFAGPGLKEIVPIAFSDGTGAITNAWTLNYQTGRFEPS